LEKSFEFNLLSEYSGGGHNAGVRFRTDFGGIERDFAEPAPSP